MDHELDGLHRVAERIPHEVVRIDALSDGVVEADVLLRHALDVATGDRLKLGLSPEPLLGLPARLADAQPVDQAVLADDLKDGLVVDLLLLGVDHDLHVADIPERGLVARDHDHARALGDHPRDDRLDRRVAERDEQLGAPLGLSLALGGVSIAVVALGDLVSEVGEAAVEPVELVGLVAEGLVLGLGALIRLLDDLDQLALGTL